MKQEPSPKEVEASAAVHASLQQLEPVDLPLKLPVAPGQRESGPYRGSVQVQIAGKIRDDRTSTSFCLGELSVDRAQDATALRSAARSAPDEAAEGQNNVGHARHLACAPRTSAAGSKPISTIVSQWVV